MNIITISQTLVTKLRNQSIASSSRQITAKGERRIHADRRKEPRFGDVVDRRK